MRAESALWRRIRPALLMAGLDPIRVENPIHPGTPDVNLADGRWVELKSVEAPVRVATILRVAHFTPQQRVWLLRRERLAPGTTWLLLEVRSASASSEWLLFDGDAAARIVGRVALAELRVRARCHTTDSQAACRLLVDNTAVAIAAAGVPDIISRVLCYRDALQRTLCHRNGKLSITEACLICGIKLEHLTQEQLKRFEQAFRQLGLVIKDDYLTTPGDMTA